MQQSTCQERTLGGRYVLRRLLGRGGMAEVHLADDLVLARRVAVKMLRVDALDATGRDRFAREAQAVASLSHPGIVAIYDVGMESVDGLEWPYIVMEYVPGHTLHQLVRSGPLAPHRALRLTAGVLEALAHAHERGIIHRDIKPANVMIAADDSVKVMDFGIARNVFTPGMTLTQTSMVVGTPEYLSPEQARGQHLDGRTDLYSTGCLLYELLTGHPPFTGESPMAIAYQHLGDEPQPPSACVPKPPAACDGVVLTALAKDPDHRYATAWEMLAAIDSIRRELGTAVSPGQPAHADTTGTASIPATPTATPSSDTRASAHKTTRTSNRRREVTTTGETPNTADQPAPRQHTARRRHAIFGALLGSLLIAGAVWAVWASAGAPFFSDTHGAMPSTTVDHHTSVQVPNLVGRPVAQARASARNYGLRLVNSGAGECPDGPRTLPRHICSQIPLPGTRVAHGSQVTVRLSQASKEKR
ncbi:protein kinase [Streptomyces sp. FXJ1.172]|uniref:protein kinase domain-containing protein n=1 Tax=Streptomyces sp. FXJ1.172 TaxID=710705 RepID=UPI0007CF04ED|nr:protein kinase [Streptomyces sp. FXJ1.172]WEO99838.1 protein kinase [Streptomyces sp. FXJ1.172]